MPMAGLGSRFVKEGYRTPKPLINVDGKAMFLKALDSVSPFKADLSLTCVIRDDNELRHNLAKLILEDFPKANVINLSKVTRGACETALEAKDFLDASLPLLILDCDLYFESEDFVEIFNTGEFQRYDGILISFHSDNSRYSYVIAEEGIARETAEKKVISGQALVGSYFWRKAGDFIKYGEESLELDIDNDHPEYYVSNAIQCAIEAGLKFLVLPGKFDSYGTPLELRKYENS